MRFVASESSRGTVTASPADRARYQIFHGDCLDVITSGKIEPASVSLIVTSPPYADQRKSNYGGIHPNDYVDWFLPRAKALQTCLKPDGSFVLNIKEKVVGGQRHTYVIELILALKKQGWLWVDEYCWHKKNCFPGKWPNRFRDSWERLLHFTLDKQFKMRQESVMAPMGTWKQNRLRNLSDTDRTRDEPRNSNGFGKKVENWIGREMAYPTNVLHLATECGYKGHPAAFPKSLPSWFIRLFTDRGDSVLDPFAGSGTTLVAAIELGRLGMGIDTSQEYCDVVSERLDL